MDSERQAFYKAILYMVGATVVGLLMYKGYPEVKFFANMIFGG